ncbi:MAG TPA: YicC/YloC family endoribonuclease [Gammaproteobacteria bacterium]
MTGFATADVLVPPFRLVWEVRSVNHRFLDLSFRLPEELRGIEPACREQAASVLRRGKVDCSLRAVAAAEGAEPVAVDQQTLAALHALESAVRATFPDARPLSVAEILRWPGVLQESGRALAHLAAPAEQAFRSALDALVAARRSEGERTAEALRERCAAIRDLVDRLRPLVDGVQARFRDKLEERLRRLEVQVQPERLEQELALLAQRVDVAEELQRLAGHVAEVESVLERAEPVGRRLDFLVQELNREANTLASKAQEEQLTRAAVELKVLIEQMREQVQNLE